MPHAHHAHHDGHEVRNPEQVNAYLVGGGIASLAAAVHLIQDAKVPANQIHILESGPLPGGSMDGAGNADTGYILRGGRMLNFSYLCTYDLLSKVPSLSHPKKTVKQEIDEFNAVPGNKTNAHARLIAKGEKGPEIVDVSQMGLNTRKRADLLHITAETEKLLGRKRIDECFTKEFFDTKFWYMWDTMFAFQPWHSAVEFRRYLHRFIQEFPRINSLAGVDRTPYNQYDSIILPIETYLKAQGVEFHYDTKVNSLSFRPETAITVSEIHFASTKDGKTGLVHVEAHDLVFITLGSMTACSSLGTNTTPPKPLPTVEDALKAPDGAWELWSSLANPTVNPHSSSFGNPSNFYTRTRESNWLSFTVTLKNPEFFSALETATGNKAGTGALVTFKDSNWLMSIVVPHQPHFLNQPPNVQVFWGYGLFPNKIGNIVQKPMSECSGSEILQELLGHLNFPSSPTLENSITIPCMMPYITAQFLTREKGDRPDVIPKGSTNLALMGQFVELPRDTVFTVEYSVRCAQTAVHELMDTEEKPRDVYMGEHNVKVLVEALRMLLT
ncbi:67 kDa myosin-cross-reactive antigen family protein [Hyaloscypha variabilis F]|uniref:67 kDa myosin-cross-reactive antigen family protein n=1 Tax=Hyaloscypha variabilis (strain UAMH 11265 / GT02V1 / F) TaxID=1149755 RepID=A0A2J6QYX9_HYAVF|nr:67 kDa myosin-cross-reactive antigen family protein [Hyaloscypha variabilis F]